jgi:hypothetical protein
VIFDGEPPEKLDPGRDATAPDEHVMLHLDLAKGAQFVDGRSVEPAAGLAEVREGANVDRAIQVDRRQVPEKMVSIPWSCTCRTEAHCS